MSELLPCPFCGNNDVFLHPLAAKFGQPAVDGVEAQYVRCDACGAEGPQTFYKVDSISAWNTRTPPAPTMQEGAIRDALTAFTTSTIFDDALGTWVWDLAQLKATRKLALAALSNGEQPEVTFAALCADQAKWSNAMFGDESVKGPIGPIKHLKKECDEVLAKPDDRGEYADLFLLTLDAHRRAGMSPQQIIDNASAKLQIVKTRTYIADPNNPDQAVEHERGEQEAGT